MICGLVGSGGYFILIQFLPLSIYSIISYCGPFTVSIFAYFMLK